MHCKIVHHSNRAEMDEDRKRLLQDIEVLEESLERKQLREEIRLSDGSDCHYIAREFILELAASELCQKSDIISKFEFLSSWTGNWKWHKNTPVRLSAIETLRSLIVNCDFTALSERVRHRYSHFPVQISSASGIKEICLTDPQFYRWVSLYAARPSAEQVSTRSTVDPVVGVGAKNYSPPDTFAEIASTSPSALEPRVLSDVLPDAFSTVPRCPRKRKVYVCRPPASVHCRRGQCIASYFQRPKSQSFVSY